VKKALMLTLGVMTAVGGFVDIGNLVTSGVAGARIHTSLVWAILLGTVGMTVFGEMAGRVTAVSQRPVFHIVRERLGVRFGLLNLVANMALLLLTMAAEIGGVALALEIASDVNYLLWVPLVALALWGVIWRFPFKKIEQLFGLLGLTLAVFVVALFNLPTDWGALGQGVVNPVIPSTESANTYFFYAISLFGACLVPYQVVFFSAGGIEEGWNPKILMEMRLNACLGFPLGGLLSIAILATSAVALMPFSMDVSYLDQVGMPVVMALGKVGLAFTLVGFFAATFAAAAESTLTMGYSVGQYLGWRWGKWLRPVDAPRFHLVWMVSLILATGFVLTTIDPVVLTIVSVVLGAMAVPLTYFPVLVVANDKDYMGAHVNKWFSNSLGVFFLAIMVVVSIVTLPLLFWTRAGA
jgi:Mn2+/Fe2+ NRAMP family transporter